MAAKRLLSDIVSITPSNYDDFVRCPRLFYCSALLGLPASDQGASLARREYYQLPPAKQFLVSMRVLF